MRRHRPRVQKRTFPCSGADVAFVPIAEGTLRRQLICSPCRDLEDREFVAAAGLEDDRCLDARDTRSVCKSVEGEVLQMLRVPHDNMNHNIVTACHEKSEAYFRHPRDVV